MKQLFTFLLLLCATQLFAKPADFAAPTQAPTTFTANGTDGDRISLSWSGGNGSKRIVVARKDAPVTFVPVNSVNYGASLVFGSGNEVAPGEFVVLNSNNTSATVSGLQAATKYYFALYEYNGTGTGIEFLMTPATANGSTVSAPTVQVTNVAVSNVIGSSLKLTWTEPPPAAGTSGRMVIGREGSPVNANPTDIFNYTANAQFGLGSEIGSGNFVLAESNTNNLTVTNLKPGTTYHFAFFEYKGANGPVYNIVSPPTVLATTLPGPTVASSAAVFSSVEGASMKLAFTKGNGQRRIVVARAGAPVSGIPADGVAYTAGAAFGTAGSELAPGEFVLANGIVDNVSVTGLAKATVYHFAVFEYDGTGAGTAYLSAAPLRASQATVSAPAVQASNLAVTTVTNNAIGLSWTPGNGSRRMVVVRKDAPVNALPADLTQYGYSSVFGSGTQLGTGNYVVYNDNSGNGVTVTGLTAGATYHVAVFEYNGASAPVYLTGNAPTTQVTTVLSPTQAPTAFQWSNVDGNRLTLSVGGGNGTHRLVVLKAGGAVTGVPANGATYTASTTFGSGDVVAPGEYVMMNGNNSQVSFLNLQSGVTYHAAVFEYNLVNGQPAYLTTPGVSNQATVSAPTVAAANLQVANVTGNSVKISWSAGNGGKRLVVLRAGSPVDAAPANYTYYTPNTTFGNGGNLGGGNFSVYSDNGNTVTVYGLATSTTYHVAVYEYNGISYPAYLTALPLTGSVQTADRPTAPSTAVKLLSAEGNQLSLQWTAGTGTKRLVVVRQGAAVSALPQDGQEYAANAAFGSGTPLQPGQFAVQSSNQSDVVVTGLQPNSTYHFAVFEYDGTGTATRYLTTAYGTFSGNTLAAPAGGPANVLFASIGTATATINWTTAVADRHLVVVRKGSAASALPQQLKAYQASTSFGHSGTVLAPEHYVVHNSNSSAVSLTGLQPGTTYHVSVYAFNGNAGPVYNTTQAAVSSFTTLGPPTDAADNVSGQSSGTSSATVRWTNGSGQKRLVLMRADYPVTAKPTDANLYTANSFFGSGQELGNSTYAVYAGSADFVTVSNLQKDRMYYIAVYEYNQFATGPVYLVSSFAQGQFNGSILPVRLQSFTGVAKEGHNLLQWTTTQEANSASFVVERSANGKDFDAIGTVAASGNSSVARAYEYEDKGRPALSFYRLRLVDRDGRTNFSAVIRVQTTNEAGAVLFPTLAASTVQLTMTVAQRTTAVLRVIDLSGRVVQEQTKTWEAGTVSTTVDVSRITKGTYFMQVQAGERTATARFIKQ